MKCFHLEFDVPELESFVFQAGQFISMLAVDSRGKNQTRAYSIASAPRENAFDLCLNRVENGFFSNYLCDLEPGAEVPFHGPHGLFVLRPPLCDTLLIATGTGIAPMRSFVERLFPSTGEDLSEGKHFWLIYGTRHESEIYYQRLFEKTAAEHSNFHYLATLSRPQDEWSGLRGYVQAHVRKALEEHPGFTLPPGLEPGEAPRVRAYICGLHEMVSANREQLVSLGWNPKQIHFERYD
jgi:ferredoxin-NADP reductase